MLRASSRRGRIGRPGSPRRRARAVWPWLALLLLPVAVGADEESEPDYARNGPYIAAGAVYMLPADWISNYESHNDDLANTSGQDSADMLDGNWTFVPIHVGLSGADLDGLWGAGGVVGWRLARHFSLELEGEWISGSSESNFTVKATGDPGHVEVKDLWTVTTNVRIFPFTGRIQPFGVAGFGIYHAKFESRLMTNGLVGEAVTPTGDVTEVSADFTYDKRKTKTDGVLRAGLGVDAYLTPKIGAEFKVDYVLPFEKTGSIETDYVSFRLGLLYRF